MMLARGKLMNNSGPFPVPAVGSEPAKPEISIVETPKFNAPDKHLIKVTACWRSMSSDKAPDIVTLSIADVLHPPSGNPGKPVHKQEQIHRIDTKEVGQAGGEMSRVLRVLDGGDIKPGRHSFQLRARRVNGDGTIVIQAAETYPAEIRVEDLGFIPPDDPDD